MNGLVLSVAVAFGLAENAAACGPREQRNATNRQSAGRPPFAIGDSVLAGAVPQVARKGIEVDAQCGRQLADGLRILRSRRTANRLPSLVIWALGTNGPQGVGDVLSIRQVIGAERQLVLVTPKGPVAWAAPTASAYRTAAEADPDVTHVADWARLVRGKRGWLAPDGIHLNAAGAAGYATMLSGSIRLLTGDVVGRNVGGPEPILTPPEAPTPSTAR